MVDEQLAPTKIKLSVYAFEDGKSHDVIFALKEDGPLPNGYKLAGTTLKCKPGDAVSLEFKLKDRTESDLVFAANEPFRAQAGPDCPPPGCGSTPEFGPPAVKGKTMTISYTAQGTEFAYALAFDGDGGPFDFDPIIINRR